MCLRLGLHFVLYPWKCLSSFFHFIIRLRGCCCLVAKSCPALCDPMNCSTPGFPVLYYLWQSAQIHDHWGGDAIQPSHLLSSLSPFAFSKTSLNMWKFIVHVLLKPGLENFEHYFTSSPPPGVYPNSCPSSRWCHPAISSSVVPFSSCPQSFPASGFFQMSQLFA